MISDLLLVVVLCRTPECLDTETSGMSSPRPTAHEHRATACTANACFMNMHALCMHCACMRTIFASISTSPPKSPIVQPASAVQHVKSQKGFVQRRPRSTIVDVTWPCSLSVTTCVDIACLHDLLPITHVDVTWSHVLSFTTIVDVTWPCCMSVATHVSVACLYDLLPITHVDVT